MPNQDRLFDTPRPTLDDFTFDTSVAAVFPDMVQRSIPGYHTILHTLGQLTQRFMQPHSRAYDLGCSVGAASLAIYHHLALPGCHIIAVDSSEAMVAECQRQVASLGAQHAIQVVHADLNEITIDCASLVVLNFTLQFIAPEQRLGILQRIYQGLQPGGLLLLSEKLAFTEHYSHQLLDELHLDFKRAQGYSELAISQKRAALEQVMRIDTLETHHTRLRMAGFKQSTLWFQCLNFGSIIALKNSLPTAYASD
jgi:tRNA (cmo5U34)-methyltransferase